MTRKSTRLWLIAILLLAAIPLNAQERRPTVAAVTRIAITVENLDSSKAFFKDVLTFMDAPAETDGTNGKSGLRSARLRLGDEIIELREFADRGQAFPADTRSNDRWFQHIAIIVSDIDRAYARLMENGVKAASKNGPQTLPDWNKNAAGIRAFYFRDPDNHFLEILQFPPEKGDPKWRTRASSSVGVGERPLFLGIDHTAIVVSDTDASLQFYRDQLGFKVVGGGENYGPEQENLNNVPGARLRITTLRAERGPAIEFLEYLNPRDGRPFPANAHENDLLHWEVLVTANSSKPSNELQSGTKTIRDPDGHTLRFVP